MYVEVNIKTMMFLLGIFLIFYNIYDHVKSILDYKIDQNVRKICENIYLNKNHEKYQILDNVFTKAECNIIIQEGEEYANKNEWSKTRHDAYPTTDNKIDENWKIYSMIENRLKKDVYPKFSKMYDLDKDKLGINEIFVVKYSDDGQRELDYHEDGSEFSFIIGLNDAFTGGGTQFKKTGELIKLKIGSSLLFCGQNTHRGKYIDSGTRYILTGFLNYGGEENICKNYIKFLEKD